MKTDFDNNTNFVTRKRCVLCNSKSLNQVLNFNKTPLANSYVSKTKKKGKFLSLSLCFM